MSTSPVFAFVKEHLKANPRATLAEVRAKAEEQGLQVQPIVYGRAKALLDLLPPKAKDDATGLADQVADYFQAIVETLHPAGGPGLPTRNPTPQAPSPFPSHPRKARRRTSNSSSARSAASDPSLSPDDQVEHMVQSLQAQLAQKERELGALRSALARVLHLADETLGC